MSDFEFVPVETPVGAAISLPPESRRTLRRIADERRSYREDILALGHSGRHFDLVWPRLFASWFLEDTAETARALARHLAAADAARCGLILSVN